MTTRELFSLDSLVLSESSHQTVEHGEAFTRRWVVETILDLVGYNAAEGAVNTPAAIRGLELCYVFAPIILVFFGGAAFIGWKLDAKRHAEIRRKLDERDALAAEAGLLDAVAGASVAVQAPH